MTATSALTQYIVRNAVCLAERCVADANSAGADTAAASQGKKKSKKSQSIVDKFLSQVHNPVRRRRGS